MSYPIGASITPEMLSIDPHAALARLRSVEPVSWVPIFGGWLVTRRDLCVEVLRDPETYTVDDPRFSTARVVGPSMLSLDGEAHRRHREPFNDPFRAGAIRRSMSDTVRAKADQLVMELAPRGRGDLRSALAAPLAVEAMAVILDLDDVTPAKLLDWYEAIVAAVHTITEGEDLPHRGRAAFAELRRAVVRNMATSKLLGVVAAEGGLSVDEIVSNVAVLLFGGIVTSESTTAIVLQNVLGDPHLVAAIDANRDLVGAAVEEGLRLEPSAAAVDRYATRQVVLGGASIGQGDLVRVSISAANRDPEVFADPDRFNPRRPAVSRHLAFARGPHACLGIHLARLETRAAVESVLDWLDGVRLDPRGPAPVEGLVFRAPRSVQAVWNG